MSAAPQTPMQTLYEVLLSRGLVENRSQLASMLRVNLRNLYHYLEPSGSNTRIGPALDTLVCWSRVLSRETGLPLGWQISPSGRMVLLVAGEPVETTWHQDDAHPPSKWAEDWRRWNEEPHPLEPP